jgi:hypothetical protein
MSIVKVIFIDDNYVYQNYPLPKKLDRSTLLSLITLEQVTSIQDLLGTELYEDLETKVDAETLDTTEAGLFNLVKYALCLYTVRSAIGAIRTAVGTTKNEEKNLDQYSLDGISNGLDAKITYINKRIVNYIKADTDLYALAASSTNDLFNEEDSLQSSIYYPVYPIEGDCDNQ